MKKNTLFFIGFILISSCSVEKDYIVTIKTNHGNMKAILYDKTSKHKENFLKLAKEGYYDSMLFHRVINEFMIQTGDPNSKEAEKGVELGMGGPGYTIPSEFDKSLHHVKGALSAARQDDSVNPEKASSGSQFFIVQGRVYNEEELTVDLRKLNRYLQRLPRNEKNDSIKSMLFEIFRTKGAESFQKKLLSLKPYIEKEMNTSFDNNILSNRFKDYTTIGGVPHLDDEYTVFGKIISGLKILDKIAEQETDQRNRPLEDVILEIEVEEMTKKKITKLFGYEYLK